MFNISFHWTLLPTFVIVSICGALKSFGNLVMCDKKLIRRQFGRSLTRAALEPADGRRYLAWRFQVCSVASCSDIASSSNCRQRCIGVTSRVIGFAPRLVHAVGTVAEAQRATVDIPPPVAGALVVFVVCFMMTSGLQIMLSNKPDSRKTFVLGSALCFGLSLDILRDLYAHVTHLASAAVRISLTLSMVVAVILHQVLRLGSGSSIAAASAPPA